MRRREPQYYCAFDLLWLNGHDLRSKPLLERKRLLRQVIPPPRAPVILVEYFVGCGVDLFRAVCDQDLEGIVAKRADAAYTPDATTWIKVKNREYSQNEGRRELFERKRSAALGL